MTERPFGVIDIGSNSVRLVLFDGVKRTPASYFNEKVLCGLGRDLATTGALHIEGRVRALAALSRFRVIFDKSGIEANRLECVATSAVRDASDGADFITEAEEILSHAIEVLPGEREAQLAAKGVLSGFQNLKGWVADLGGGSLELATVGDGAIKRTVSHPFGTLRLTGLKQKETKQVLRDAFAPLKSGKGRGTLCLVGGTWRVMAKSHMAQRDYPIKVLHHYGLSADETLEFAESFIKTNDQVLEAVVDIPARRMESVPAAALVLRELLKALAPEKVIISAHGVREGVIFERLSPEARKLDPLIEGAKAMATRSSLDPDIGIEIVDFAADFFEGHEIFPFRLVEAAARLSDIAWRDHANYRRGNILHAVLHSPLDGLTHLDRIRIALSLYYRHSGESAAAAKAVARLVGSQEQKKARIVGNFLRLAHTLVGQTAGILPACGLTQNEDEIILTVSQGMSGLVGEVVVERLALLGEHMGKATRVEIKDYL